MNIFSQNKYTKWYMNIIETSKIRESINGYSEKHHILPKSLGGDNAKDNITILTAKEHFICHWLLTKMVKSTNHKKKMLKASWCMMVKSKNHNRQYTAAQYEKAKIMLSEAQKGHEHYGPFIQSEESNEARRLKLKGVSRGPQSNQHRANMSKAKQNISVETRRRISEAAKNRKRLPHSEETKRKIGLAHKGRQPKTGTCSVCNRTMAVTNLAKYHNEKCKQGYTIL